MKYWATVSMAVLFVALSLSSCQSIKSETVRYKTTYNQEIYGKLYLPEGEGPFPVVVWFHPTTRHNPTLADWRRDLRNNLISNRIGIFIADLYSGRGLPQRAPQLSSENRYYDGAQTLKALASHPKIDENRIGISGASYGANVALRMSWEWYVSKLLPEGLRYAAHVPIYPPCSKRIEDYDSTGAPVLILIGEKDWNDATRCQDRVIEMNSAGGEVELVIYPNAYHCFISSKSPKVVNAEIYTDCGIQIVNGRGGYSYRDPDTVKGGVYPSCVRKSGICGGNPSAKSDALKRTVSFFIKNLRNK